MRVAAWILLVLLAGCRGAGTAPPERREAWRVELAGERSFDDRTLFAAMADELRELADEPSKAAVDDAAWALQDFLRGRGFPRARVDYSVEPGPDGTVARLTVEEGPRTQVQSVELEGVESFDPERLQRSFSGPTEGLSGGHFWLVRDRLEAGRRELERFYLDRGFHDVEVGPARIETSDDGRQARVVVAVREGPRYRFDPPLLEGDPERAELLREIGREVTGEPYAVQRLAGLRGRLVDAYRRRGFPDVEVELEPETRVEPDGSGHVLVRGTVRPGPRVRIGAIRVEGNRKTRAAFVRSALPLEPGDWYDAEAVREGFLELYRTGAFRGVDIDLVGEGDARDLVVTLDELPSTELYVEPGWGSYERLRITLGATERNLFGTGRTLNLEGGLSELNQKLVLNLINPRLLGSPYSVTYSLFGVHRAEPAFTREALGVGATVRREWNPRWSSSAGYQFQLTDIFDVDPNDPTVADEQNAVDISSFTLTTSRDTRDGKILPERGLLSSLTAEWGDRAFGSQLDFVRLRWNQSGWVPLRDGTQLALSYRGGVIAPTDGGSIPLQERFFNGGENTVRSYRQDKLGPKDPSGKPIGGEARNVLTFELRQRLYGSLTGALFADAGNVVPQAGDWIRFEDLRYGLGGGLRYLLPVGPLRVDAAWNPDPDVFDDRWAIHFSVGMAF